MNIEIKEQNGSYIGYLYGWIDTAEADTFFPPYEDDWQEENREDHPVDDRHAFPYSFVDYSRLSDVKQSEKAR